MNIASAQYTTGITGNNINVKVITTDNKEFWVPLDNANSDYIAVLAWVEAGNTIEAAD